MTKEYQEAERRLREKAVFVSDAGSRIQAAQWCDLHHSFHRDCNACVDADYARLEAAIEAKDVALGDLEQRAKSLIADKQWAGYSRLKAMAQIARAALSPDAGKGWPLTEADREAIREGVKAMKEGRVTPWEDVERELFGGEGGLPPEVKEHLEALCSGGVASSKGNLLFCAYCGTDQPEGLADDEPEKHAPDCELALARAALDALKVK